MKVAMMILSMAVVALFSVQALACGGCGCDKGEPGDDDDDNVTMSAIDSPSTVGFCGKEAPDDGSGES